VAQGEKLWNDKSLGKSGLACASCHVGNYSQMNPSFAQPYPHRVAMPQQMAHVSEVNAAEMVNFCMMVPMASEPLPWSSQKLAALTAYVKDIQAKFDPSRLAPASAANPCNPCGMRHNPCNPCGMKRNPCGARHM